HFVVTWNQPVGSARNACVAGSRQNPTGRVGLRFPPPRPLIQRRGWAEVGLDQNSVQQSDIRMRRVASRAIQMSRGAGELVLARDCRLLDIRKDVRKRGAAKNIGDTVGIGAKWRLIVGPTGRETTV